MISRENDNHFDEQENSSPKSVESTGNELRSCQSFELCLLQKIKNPKLPIVLRSLKLPKLLQQRSSPEN